MAAWQLRSSSVQMAVARGARVIASAGEGNQDYLREIGAIPVLYGEGIIARVRAAAGGRVDAVFDVAGKTPVDDLIRLTPEPSQVVTIKVQTFPFVEPARTTASVSAATFVESSS